VPKGYSINSEGCIREFESDMKLVDIPRKHGLLYSIVPGITEKFEMEEAIILV
jgi:hypothetical protein